MDGQTEWVNQEIEAYLWVFISHHQDDWVDWLPLVEFAYNNRVHSATCCTPFELDSGQHPQTGSGGSPLGDQGMIPTSARRRIEKKTTSQSSAKAPSYTMGAVGLSTGPLPIN